MCPLVFIQKLLRPLCLSKALPYWHFFTLCFWRPEEMTVLFSLSPGLFFVVLFFSFGLNIHQIWRRPPSKGKYVKKKTLNGLQTLYLKWKWTWTVWNEVYLLKIFYWGSKWDLEQSTVYVIYLIQESRSLEKPCFRTSTIHIKMFQATNQTFVLISFILYGDKKKKKQQHTHTHICWGCGSLC